MNAVPLVQQMHEQLATLASDDACEVRPHPWQALAGLPQLLPLALHAAVDNPSPQVTESLEACWEQCTGAQATVVERIQAYYGMRNPDVDVDCDRLSRNVCLWLASSLAAATARLAASGATSQQTLRRWLDTAASASRDAQDAGTRETGAIALTDTASASLAVSREAAWLLVRWWLREPLPPTRMLRVPIASTYSRRGASSLGLIASLNLALHRGAPRGLIEEPEVMLRPLDQVFLETMSAVSQEMPCAVRWSLGPPDCPASRDIFHPWTPLVGDSFGASAAVGLRLLNQDRIYDSTCLILARVSEQDILAHVGEEREKLHAAHQNGMHTAVLADTNTSVSEQDRDVFAANALVIRKAGTVADAEAIAAMPTWAVGLRKLTGTAPSQLPGVIVWVEFPDVVTTEQDLALLEMLLVQPKHGDPFYIDRYPVTVGRYQAFQAATGVPLAAPSSLSNEHPMTNLPVSRMLSFAERAGKRLPTFDEWRSAVLGGAGEGSGQSIFDALNWEGLETVRGLRRHEILPVLPNSHQTLAGLCDVLGNAAEVVRAGPEVDRYLACGGCYTESIETLKKQADREGVPSRWLEEPSSGHPLIGFRCMAPVPLAVEEAVGSSRVYVRQTAR